MSLFRLSQGQLNILGDCPRKFQHIYLDQLGSPTPPENQERLDWGKRFHLLMQQREMGLPIESLMAEDMEMRHCFHGFLNAAPQLFTPHLSTDQVFREAEHERTLTIQQDSVPTDYLLIAVYDLLIAEPHQAQILDWKTYPKPPKDLAENWQTRLYPYILVETSSYQPEQVSMTYWFVQPNGELPQYRTFNYDSAKHEQTRHDLTQILASLTEWRRRYHLENQPLPQCSISEKHCNFCQFAIRCQRTPNEQANFADELETTPISPPGIESRASLIPDLAEIEEIPI